jgi:large subunit ribosomal protein L23
MALLDFLKKKEEIKKSKKPEKKTEKVSVVKEKKEVPVVKAQPVARKSVKQGSFSYEAVKEPHISEKATYLAEENQYTFEVGANFNKSEIKKSIAGIYGVDVLSVNIIKIPAKKRRLGKTQGWRKGYKKAIVTIKEGQKIEII